MAPMVDRSRMTEMVGLDAAIAIVAFVVVGSATMIAWMVCGCGGGKKKEEEAPPPEEPGKEAEKSIGKGAEASAKAAGEPSAKPKSEKTKGLEPPPAGKMGDATEVRKGPTGPEMKRAAVPKGGAVSGDNPAYQTLMSDSQFKASQKPGGKAQPEKVAASNPAYQTIMNDSKFEASQKPKAGAKGPAKAAASMAAATAMAGPTDAQTVVKTAIAGGTTKK